MSRLRIRIELNRGGAGVPLHKLARVVDESQRFFHMLAEDVHVDETKGEWLGFDFDHESLNFTAEFVGPATEEQVRAFNAAFDGTTPLRRATIGQFARITDAIEGDEVIGFGLYQADDNTEPAEWRALSRRDALRITDEIQVLISASEPGGANQGMPGESEPDSRLPAVANAENGGHIFAERHERSVETRKWASVVREVEANLSKRISHVENELDEHTGLIQDLRSKTGATEDSVLKVLGAVEKFCTQTSRQVELISRASLPVPSAPPPPPAFPPKWMLAASVGILSVVVIAGLVFWAGRSAQSMSQASTTPTKSVAAEPAPEPAPRPEPKPVAALPPAPSPQPAKRPPSALAPARAATDTPNRLEIEASEPTWVSVTASDGTKVVSRLFVPGDTRSYDLSGPATLRAGNAGGIQLRFNGNPVGPVGLHGQVRDVLFNNGTYKIVPIPQREP